MGVCGRPAFPISAATLPYMYGTVPKGPGWMDGWGKGPDKKRRCPVSWSVPSVQKGQYLI
jgi:hypothetical protein